MKNFGGKGLRKYSLVKSAKNFLISQAKSDFANIRGHKMYLGPKDSLGLSINGIYEKLETELIKNEIKNGDVVLDIGANIGYYTLIFAKLVGNKGRVFAFEPEPFNFSLLEKNIEINNYKNVIIENTAVSDKNGEIKLYLSKKKTGMHRIYPSHLISSDFVNVKMISSDDYFHNHKYGKKISFLKIDVEGSELGVLRGMKEILENNPNIKILLEFIPSCVREFGAEPRNIIEFLIKNKFNFSFINDEKNKIESIKDPITLLEKFDDDPMVDIPRGTNLFCTR